MDFSVAIPAFNSDEFLDETLNAIFGQTLPAREVVVVDDGSTDTTSEVIARHGGKVRLLTIDNSGPGAARKRAIEACDSDWIALCDADDLWEDCHLERKARIIDSVADVNVIASNFYSFGPGVLHKISRLDNAGQQWLDQYAVWLQDGLFLVPDAYAALLAFNPVFPSGLAFKRSHYDEIGGIDPAYSRWNAEDAEFTRRIVASTRAKLIIDSTVTWHYRRHSSNFSADRWKNLEGKANIIDDHLIKHIVPEHCIEFATRTVASARGSAFDAAYWDQCYAEAVRLFGAVPRGQRNVQRWARYLLAYTCSLSGI